MQEGQLVDLTDLIKMKIYDEEGAHVGHLQDLALDGDLSSPYASFIVVHLHWTDQVGEVELGRPVEDIVLLMPWSCVASLEENAVHLDERHPDFPVETARGKLLLRRDVLNKQMVDEEGNRLQRVDEVLISREGKALRVAGLKVSRSWFSSGSNLQSLLERLRQKHEMRGDVEMIPWEAVRRVDGESIVIGTD